jgi:tetratricopeptide (TPR) repeat protein
MPLAISFVLIVVLFVQNVAAQDVPAQDHARIGISLAKEGKLSESEHELREAVSLAPDEALYRAQLASILGLQEKWKESLASFQKAIDLAPENLDFRRETAAVQWQLGLLRPAEENLQYVLTKQPADSRSILLLGLVKERDGDYTAATQLLDSQFSLVISQPDRTVALFHSVVGSSQREKIPKIVEALKAHANDKAWSSAIARCTQIAAMAEDLDSSQALFALIPDNDPEQPAAGLQLARLLYSRGQVAQSKELLMNLAGRGVASADLQVLLGNCFESEHQFDLALQAYQHAVALDPARVEYYRDLISLLLDLGRTNDAIALVNRALTIAPNDARPWLWKGNVSLRTHAYKDAIESYTRAGVLDSSTADAVLGVAAVHFVSGQNDAAIAEYRAGIARFPNDARLYVACASLYLASPDAPRLQADAEDLLQKAVKLAPQSAEAHYQLGQLALQQNRLKDAEAELLRSLQSEPDRSKAHFALSVVYRRMGRSEDATRQFAIYQDLKRTEESGTTAVLTSAGKP